MTEQIVVERLIHVAWQTLRFLARVTAWILRRARRVAGCVFGSKLRLVVSAWLVGFFWIAAVVAVVLVLAVLIWRIRRHHSTKEEPAQRRPAPVETDR